MIAQPNVHLHKAVPVLFLVPLHHPGLRVLVRSECRADHSAIPSAGPTQQPQAGLPVGRCWFERTPHTASPVSCDKTSLSFLWTAAQRSRTVSKHREALTLMSRYLTSKPLNIYISEVKAAAIQPKSSGVSMAIKGTR
jgi:hypothetical protein